MNEEAFRRSIETRLRQGKADAAIEQLRRLLAPYAGPGLLLPQRFLTVKADDLYLIGWEGLDGAVRRHDQPGRPVSALSIAFGWPGESVPEPNAEGQLAPHIETSYFTDEIFPFSQSARDDLLDGYSYHGCTWGDDCEATDTALSLTGINDLHGALASLEARLLASDEPDEEGIRAGSLGACLLSALLFQAVGQRIERDGLPRPLCVMAGSNGVYPYFDAPVVGISDDARKAAEAEAELALAAAGQSIPAPRYSSLVLTGIPRAKKRAVLVLEEQEEEMAIRIARLRGSVHTHAETEPDASTELPDSSVPHLPEAATGATLGTTIIPMPGGPLLAKKPAKPAWDFRDMLPPRDPELEPHETPQPDPDDFPGQPAPATAGEPPEGPVISRPVTAGPLISGPVISVPAITVPVISVPVIPMPEPALAEPSLQERLQALIAPPALQKAGGAEPAAPIEHAPIEPHWDSGHLWLTDDDAPPPSQLSLFQTIVGAPRRLWARLCDWMGI